MIDVARVRTEIGDEPRWATPQQGPPEILTSQADGNTSTFYLRHAKAILTAGVRVYIGTRQPGQPMSWAPIAANDVTNPWTVTTDSNGWPIIQFTAANPAGNKAVGARYMIVSFTDAQIQNYISDTTARDTDQRTLWAIHLAMIPAILANRETMTIQRNGDIVEDIGQWIQAQRDLLNHFQTLLQPQALGGGPAMGIGGYSVPPYQP